MHVLCMAFHFNTSACISIKLVPLPCNSNLNFSFFSFRNLTNFQQQFYSTFDSVQRQKMAGANRFICNCLVVLLVNFFFMMIYQISTVAASQPSFTKIPTGTRMIQYDSNIDMKSNWIENLLNNGDLRRILCYRKNFSSISQNKLRER